MQPTAQAVGILSVNQISPEWAKENLSQPKQQRRYAKPEYSICHGFTSSASRDPVILSGVEGSLPPNPNLAA